MKKAFNVEVSTKHFKGSLTVIAETYEEAEAEALSFLNDILSCF